MILRRIRSNKNSNDLSCHPTFNSFSFIRSNVPKPVALNFNFLDNAAQCPLPDSGTSSPDPTQENSKFKLPETPSNIEQQYKRIQIDGNHSFYLIRHTDNKPYIPCFHLARLLHLSESEILSDTVSTIILHSIENLFSFLLVVITAYSFPTNIG